MKTLIGFLRRLARDRGGNAILEFAIGSGILVAAFTGTFQFGYTFLQYNNLQNAATRGARWAALAPYDSLTTTPSTAFRTAVVNMVLYGSTTQGTSPVLPRLSPEHVQLQVSFLNGVPSTVSVSITGYTVDAVFSLTTFNMKPRVTYAYQGIWTPI